MRVNREHNERMLQAWVMVALGRHRTLPAVESMYAKDSSAAPAKPKQTVDEMIAAAIYITQMSGGKVHYRGERLH